MPIAMSGTLAALSRPQTSIQHRIIVIWAIPTVGTTGRQMRLARRISLNKILMTLLATKIAVRTAKC
ncbi:hypothetical protein Pan44_50930 [Caulifigura coniformis]|uniref:Uncharacterized protein n=2 Tax=Caulifigura coniformis TaxID=2527983 RepID=A0A517SLN3_9PLAN|nr:hypothetical protein Pan44_50930 [Caulifigura coniformis]